MAKYYATYNCGHGEMIELFGKEKERERKLEWLESCLCPECLAQQQAEEQKQLLNVLTKKGIELPALTGSEKQIKWAETIRASKVEYHQQLSEKGKVNLAKFKEAYENKLKSISQEKKEEFILWAEKKISSTEEYIEEHGKWMTETYAGWFIDRRNL